MKSISAWRHTCVQAMVTALCVFAIAGCCKYRMSQAAPIRDRLNTYVLVGIGVPPKCCLPPSQRRLFQSKRGEESTIWVKSVFFDHIGTPIANVTVHLDVIDAFGDPTTNAHVEPAVTITTVNGFAKDTIRFVATDIGTFRIRASYCDRQVASISLGPTVVVLE